MRQYNDETWKNAIRRRLSAFDIPLTLKEEVIDLMKPIAVEVNMWEVDHYSIFTTRQKRSLKFCFHADGTVDRVKTADSLIHSKGLDVQTRFLLACQYWSSYDILNFFKKVRRNTRNRILRKYSKERHNLNEHQKNVVKWVEHYRAGSPSRRWARWTLPSLQSRRLDDVSRGDCAWILVRLLVVTNQMHIGRFCLSRMNTCGREVLLAFFPLKVLRIYFILALPTFLHGCCQQSLGSLIRGRHYMVVAHHYLSENFSVMERLSLCGSSASVLAWKPRSFKTICRRNRHFRNIGGNSKEWI
ncbi:uncharacterized protein TNIN_341281 [Trichonephila inaurata madagascariensis]|uniref:Uncharacterized protein n=1 Tax=Trichonephila inaurata madagascariensis TaxID=2747483 RepID=A0A8X6XPH5_9ARAC|nr:uncharacterized protein TNIN_341281 [Trichonephila inaurata madagascariensis]